MNSQRNVSIYCPHCQRYTDLRVGQHFQKGCDSSDKATPCIWNENGDRNPWWIGICNSCQKPVLVSDSGNIIYPTPRPTPTDQNIPEVLREDLDEAKLCFSSACYRGCAVLARRVIQVACIKKGAPAKTTLVEQIKDLTMRGLITKEIEEWATVVRWIGNDAAHPDDSQPVEQEDAEDCLNLAEQFLNVIFVTPAIAQARRKARGK
jgi:Domain of unknown function (DUF4145)